MTNTDKLNEYIEASGYKKSYIAKVIGVSIRALSMKSKNKTQFKASEIESLCRLLEINEPEEVWAVFFAQDVAGKSTNER